jgi:hypothetical protein
MQKVKIKMDDCFSANLLKKAESEIDKILFGSVWEWEHWRKGEIIDQWKEKNICTDEGLESILGQAFSDVTQITTHYVAIYNTNTTPVAGMTYASPQFTETTHYSEGVRQTWQEAGVSSKSITNSANKASFTMNTAETIYGGALVGGGSTPSTKGDKAGGGVLFNVSAFSGGSKAVVNTDVLKVTITLTIADA